MDLVFKLRGILYGWIEDLRAKIKMEEDQKALAEKLDYLMHCAGVCRMTYEIPEAHANTLFNGLRPNADPSQIEYDPKHLAIFLETGAIIRDNLPPRRDYVPEYFRLVIDRSNRLSHRWEIRARAMILQDPRGIDLAVEKQWQPHIREGDWTAADSPNQHWLRANIRPLVGGNLVQISLNLLDGQILINRIPFGRLPLEYVTHPTYERIFGGNILSVGSSSLLGMQFQTRFPIGGHHVHLGLKDGELIVRSERDSKVYELIPHNLLLGDFCEPLVEKYIHWMELGAMSIQFRTKDDKWNTDSYEWKLSWSTGEPLLSHASDPNIHAVDIGSLTGNRVCDIFGALEAKDRILVTTKTSPGQDGTSIEVELEKLNLKFVSKGSAFWSHNFPGFIVDEDQNLGCFHGLVNKLLLCKGEERMAIIPFGDIVIERVDGRTFAKVQTVTHYQTYTIDKRLGRLVGDGSITSRLTQVYLHAVSSSPACQIDALTGRTGTEEAASLLFSGAVKSFQELSPADIKLLHLIAKLTPHRSLGAPSKRSNISKGRIERVIWNDELSFNLQRDVFRAGSQQIVGYWLKLKWFVSDRHDVEYDLADAEEQDETDAAIEEGIQDKNLEEGVNRGNELILRRAAFRNEMFYAFLKDTWKEDHPPYVDPAEGENSSTNQKRPNQIEDLSYTGGFTRRAAASGLASRVS
ncbi:hypothetical protein ABW19_dt0203429 [Dactylella cylindrospora]|nr:hypothetical protein ABW19_dt0203429 [Dactylella cylindrospora]